MFEFELISAIAQRESVLMTLYYRAHYNCNKFMECFEENVLFFVILINWYVRITLFYL